MLGEKAEVAKAATPADKAKADASANEAAAVLKLKLAKRLTSEASRPELATRLGEIVKEYPGTKAAEEAAKMLADLKKPAKGK